MTINLLLSLVPIALYVILLVILDSFALVRKNAILCGILCGMVMCGVAYAVAVGAGSRTWIIPVVEEGLKGMVVLYLVAVRRIRFFAEALILGAAAGGGFALAENIAYTLFFADVMQPAEALMRGMGTALMHMGLAGLSGVLLLFLSDVHGSGSHGLRGALPLWASYLLTLLPSAFFHLSFNAYLALLPPLPMMLAVLVAVLLLFMLLFKVNEVSVHNYLETSIVSNVQLLSAMKNGDFTETHCGRYLISVREQFRPEVFFDMLCYLQLSLEVSMMRTRDIILAETDFPMPRDAERERKEAAIRKEFDVLERRIGKTGRAIIRPLVH